MTATAPDPAGPALGQSGPARRQLDALLPDRRVDVSAFAVDGVSPAVATRPTSAEEVVQVLAAATEAGASVIPHGGGVHRALGMPPRRYDLAIDMTGLDQMLEYEPADLTVTAQAGARLGDLQSRLRSEGQWLPLDPPGALSATIGGVLAVNASGPARIAFGTARDLVIGMTVATPEGGLVSFGGRVVKNVAGYDIAKAHIGAMGTLGVIVQASLKVAPLPRAVQTLVAPSSTLAPLLSAAFAVRHAGLPTTGIALSHAAGAAEGRLLLRFAGSSAAVERSSSEALRLARAAGLGAEQAPEAVWEEAGAIRGLDSGAVVRVSHLASRAEHTIEQLLSLGTDVMAYPTAGIAYARILALSDASLDRLRDLRASFEAAGGALVLESAPPAAKAAFGVWGGTRSDFALMRRLKEQLDSRSTLSPGRFLGDL